MKKLHEKIDLERLAMFQSLTLVVDEEPVLNLDALSPTRAMAWLRGIDAYGNHCPENMSDVIWNTVLWCQSRGGNRVLPWLKIIIPSLSQFTQTPRQLECDRVSRIAHAVFGFALPRLLTELGSGKAREVVALKSWGTVKLNGGQRDRELMVELAADAVKVCVGEPQSEKWKDLTKVAKEYDWGLLAYEMMRNLSELAPLGWAGFDIVGVALVDCVETFGEQGRRQLVGRLN